MRSIKLLACAALPALALAGPALAQAGASYAIDTIAAPRGVALSEMAAGTPMRVILSLPLRDAAGAAAFAASVSDPRSPNYGHYLTPREFAARFGADAATYEFLRSWAAAKGLAVGRRTESRTTLSLGGTAAQFGRIFATRFAGFETAEHGDGYTMLVPPRMPAELAGRVSGVVGLSSAGHFFPLARLPLGPRADVGTGVNGSGYSPSDLRTAYNVSAQTSSAKTETLALFEQGGLRATQVTTYETKYGLPKVKLTPVSVNGSSFAVNTSVELEALLDVDAATGMNPSIPEIRIYEDSKDSFQVALLDALNQMASDNIAKVVSISYGQDESMQGTSAIMSENTAFTQLAAQGISVFVSSGDQGAEGRTGSGLHAPDPGSQPYVTCVGGTSLQTVSAGGAYKSEVVWFNSNSSATGGGVSSVWSIPSYQVIGGVSVAKANGGSSTMRNVPDIAADADPNTPYSVYDSKYGGYIGVGGTSLAAPLWAGFATVINSDRVAAGKARLGFFNPALYPLGVTGTGFHDITSGKNGTAGYSAGPGYDNATGFGSINFASFLPTIP